MIEQTELARKHYNLDLANQRIQNKLNHVSDPNSLQSDGSPLEKETASNYTNWN